MFGMMGDSQRLPEGLAERGEARTSSSGALAETDKTSGHKSCPK